MSARRSYHVMGITSLPDRNALLTALLLFSLVCGAAIALFGPTFTLVVVIGLVGTAAAFLNYRLGVWLLVLLLPLTGTTIFPHKLFGITGANPYNLLLVVTLLSFVAHSLWRGSFCGPFAYPRLWWAYVAPLTLGGLIGSYHVGEIPAFAIAGGHVLFDNVGGYVRDAFIKPITYLLFAMLLGAALRDGLKSSAVVVALCLSVHLVAAWILFYVVSHNLGLGILSSAQFRSVLRSTGIHSNDLGVIAAFILTLMMFTLAHNWGGWLRWLLLVTAAVAGGLLVISFSRGAFVAFLVGMSVFFLTQRRPGVIVVTVLIIVAILPFLPGELYERLTTGFNTGGKDVLHSANDPITAGRVAGVWLPLLPEVLKHPFFGNGLWSVAWSDPFRNGAIAIESFNPHNLYLKALLDVGPIGLGLFALFFLDLRRRFLNAAADPGTPPLEAGLFRGSAAAMLGYAVFGLSGGDFVPTTANVYLWMLFGLLLGRQTGATPANRASG